MSAINIRLPDSLHKRVREVAKREHVSINQMITLALAEKLSALDTAEYLEARANRAMKDRFQDALQRVPDVEPADQDRLE